MTVRNWFLWFGLVVFFYSLFAVANDGIWEQLLWLGGYSLFALAILGGALLLVIICRPSLWKESSLIWSLFRGSQAFRKSNLTGAEQHYQHAVAKAKKLVRHWDYYLGISLSCLGNV